MDSEQKMASEERTSRPPSPLVELAGWGANLRAECQLWEPETETETARFLDPAGTIARGLGRSYGDPALNAGRRVLGLRHCDRYLQFNPETGALTCEAGVSLAQIIEDFTPRGFFPMITPGTKFVTIGGCIANDVHGKAHHAQGSFCESVDEMSVLLASGDVVTASREENVDLFWGMFGGMGLLGIALSATIRLRKVETTFFHQRAVRARSLEELMGALDEYDLKYPYSVAYVDPVATGVRLGNGVLTVGDHAALADLPPKLAWRPLMVSGPPKLSVPFELPEITLNPVTVRLVNLIAKAKQAHGAAIAHYESFLYPLDMIGHWNRGYGRRGFTQYQFVIPFDDGPRRMREILTTMVSAGELPFLNVLKRLGKQSGGPLSFPQEGYTFAIDFPVRRNTVELLRRLDAMVLDAGGRIYLGKDSYVQAEMFHKMYPSVAEFIELKAKYDPNMMFTSDLARRVGLVS